MAYVVQLKDFEGPLDLLLHLIAKHKLDARAGFVHVPYTPEMVAKKAEQLSTMSFENMKRAVEVVAKASVDYEQDISLVCGACS